VIERSLARRDNIVAIGATAAGKTSFVNALLAHLLKTFPDERLGVIEDEPELQFTANNAIRRIVHGQADMRRHVREMLRMRPDRIIVGEVRGAEALDLLKAWNSGHSGGFTTVHANSGRAALLRLESLMQEAGVPPNPRLIAESIDLLIFIARRPDGARTIVELARVEGCPADGGYQLKPIVGVED
jgi:type IV secretion system protein VirB11